MVPVVVVPKSPVAGWADCWPNIPVPVPVVAPNAPVLGCPKIVLRNTELE